MPDLSEQPPVELALLRYLAAQVAANRFYGLPDDHEPTGSEELLEPPRSQVVKVALELLSLGEICVEDYV